MIKITSKESIAIRYLRAIATFLIVACHFLQTQGDKWAYILNVGVQLFFVISGYLYGAKNITSWRGFFYGRWRKLYVPYFVFFVVVLLLLKLLHIPEVEFKDFIKLTYLCQGFLISTAPGIGHLWFVTAIFACYWITPLLQKVTSLKDGKVNGIFLLLFGLFSFFIFYSDNGYSWYYAWFFNYSIGYYLANTNTKYKLTYLIMSCVLLILICFKITWLDIIEGSGINMALHGFLAHLIFILFILGSKLIKREVVIQPFKIIEEYSFFIYFVHYPFTRVPWSVVGCTNSIILDILFLLFAIVSSTFLLVILSKYTGLIVDKVLNDSKDHF